MMRPDFGSEGSIRTNWISSDRLRFEECVERMILCGALGW